MDAARMRRWWQKHPRQIAAGIAAISVCAWWTAHHVGDRPRVQVATATVTSGPIVRRIIANGTLQAVTTVEVGSQVSGTIQSLAADYNSVVHAGQILATLDPALFDTEVQGARAALGEAQAALVQEQANLAGARTTLSDAQQKLTRAEALAAQQLLTPSDLDAARIELNEAGAGVSSGESAIRAAESHVAEARAALDLAVATRSHTIIHSPIDGIVLSRNVDVGQTVAASVQAPVLFTIAADLRRMQVEVDIDEADIGGIRPGEAASFEVESYPDEVFAGKVADIRLQPVAEQTITSTAVQTSTAAPSTTNVAAVIAYATMIAVDNPDERLRPGMTATVTLDGARQDHAIRIPNSALSFRPPPAVLAALGLSVDIPRAKVDSGELGRTRQVWRYDGKRFTPVEVRTGLADSLWTELVSGPLQAGDALATGASVVGKGS